MKTLKYRSPTAFKQWRDMSRRFFPRLPSYAGPEATGRTMHSSYQGVAIEKANNRDDEERCTSKDTMVDNDVLAIVRMSCRATGYCATE